MSVGEEEDSMKCSFCSETEALAVMFFVFLSTPVIQLCHPVLSGGPSVALDITPSPLYPTFCFFDYLCFYRTLMAVFKTHCDVEKKN